ncbi:MAG: extracellular elastinolytic metalloproteinase, partial [Thermoleophilaceae bacterium]|nr:extracellular elastinolytic metalloproteinase [Thermoleophilaceae bacterium]
MHSLLRALLGAIVSVSLLFVAAPAGAVPSPKGQKKGAFKGEHDPGKAAFDIRDKQRQTAPLPQDAASIKGRDSLSNSLGRQGILDFDPQTGTPKTVAKLDGFLTAPSGDDAAKVALDYVSSHESVFHLTAADIAGLKLDRRYTDTFGITHLVWAQVHDGIAAFDNDLHANVAKDGRLINISGSPVADFATRTLDPKLGAGQALGVALDDAGHPGLSPRANPKGTRDQLTTFSGGHDARLVLFTERPGDTHLAWEVTAVAAPNQVYDDVVDAQTGELLYRENTVDFAGASLNVWEYAPGIDTVANTPAIPTRAGEQSVHSTLYGGDPIQVNSGSALDGPYAHTYPDSNEDNAPDAEVPANSGTTWNNSFTTFSNFFANCSSTFPRCSWDEFTPNTFDDNLRQNAAQVYFYVNNFHDWLAKEPNIGFNTASGNFEAAGGDAVNAEILDGANGGNPDGNHVNNANMSTQRDGIPPRMQMYLFNSDGNTPDANGGDDASVIYHEYSHGLSNRLVTGGTGSPTLRSFHARAMGEGWSDFYAMDYLNEQGLDFDTATEGDVAIGYYIEGGQTSTGLRSQPLDCEVNVNTSSLCPGGNTPHSGGYTLADMGHVISGGPEFHADGEIWAETLWDVRRSIGAAAARRDITGGMRLSPPDPSMIDMRNAILQADQVLNGGANRT